jgi:hypothetical protein
VNRDGVNGHSTRVCCVDGVGIDWCGVCGHGADWDGIMVSGGGIRARCADGVDGNWVGRGGLRGYGTDWDGDRVSGRSANRVDGGNGGRINMDRVSGHCVRECGVNGVDDHVIRDWVAWDGVDSRYCVDGSRDGIDWLWVRGVVCDGTEAQGLVDLCCPVEPFGFVLLHRIRRGVGCKR